MAQLMEVYIHPHAGIDVVDHPNWIKPPDNLDDIFEYEEFPFPGSPAIPQVFLPFSNANVSSNAQINDNRYYTNGINVRQ